MLNDKDQSFDLEQWLNIKKKGFSGKVPRSDFIEKIKELGVEIEEKKQLLTKQENEKQELITKNNELQNQVKSLQAEIADRDQIIRSKGDEISSKEEAIKNLNSNLESLNENYEKSEKQAQELTTKLAEQTKNLQDKNNELQAKDNELQNNLLDLQSKDEELRKLQSRPDITEQEYQKLLNNQEKHQKKDLKPEKLPADWETKLASIKDLETRPTNEQLIQAVENEAAKYEGYKKLNNIENEAIDNYWTVKKDLNKWTSAFSGQTAEEAKKKYDELEKKESLEKQQNPNVHEALKTEIEQLKKEFENYKNYKQETNNNEIIIEIKELIKAIVSWKLEKEELNKQQPVEQKFFDYNSLKAENESLWKIIKGLSPYER